ncbi:MAG: YceI family protein [Bacteroidota bacterium]
MRKSMKIILGLAVLLTAAALTVNMSFDPADAYTYDGETPGTLTAIGDAGSPNVFTFERWHFAEISMPDNDPTQIKAVVDIDVTSAVCDWKELESSVLAKKDYFFVKKFPKATVTVDGATAQDDGSYLTEAILNLKGVEGPVALTFTISDEAPYEIEGSALLMRRKFKFKGNGPKDEVPIAFSATLPLE